MNWFKLLVLLCLFHVGLWTQLPAQVAVVKGTVSISTVAVQNASVTFEDNDDPTNTYSVWTDVAGKYQITIFLTSAGQGTPLPAKFELAQNYPNPFSSSTAISYRLKGQVDIRVTIFDILGRVVWETDLGAQSAGTHSIFWDGSNGLGQRVAPGVYFYRLQAGGESQVRKMVLSRGEGDHFSLAPKYAPPTEPNTLRILRPELVGNFRVRIENTRTTSPPITPRQIDNVLIQGDTTLNFLVDAAPTPVDMVYVDSLRQSIRGFGGADIIPWRPAMSASEIQTAFGAGPGQLGFTILRLRIPYTDDVSEFSAQLSVAQMAQSQGAIVFASPWTPPPAMKSNNNIVGGTLNESSYAAYAAHLDTFADYMANNGAPLYAVSVQNEPDATVNYESCSWNATQFLNFMKNNAAAIGSRVMMPESQNFVHGLSDPTLNDSTACAHLAIIGGHIYGGGLASYPLAVSKGKEVWMTEHLVLDTTWTAVLATGREIHDCLNAGMNAYVWWYIVRYYGPIGEDGNVTKRGFVMSQFARFVRPGYDRIKCSPMPQPNVYVSSYLEGSSSKVVIVALNMGTSALTQSFSIPNGVMSSFSSYTTSASKSCVRGDDLPVTNGSFTVTLDASSITTFVSN